MPDPPTPGGAPPALARPGTTSVRSLVSSGQPRQYRLALPRRPVPAGTLPLILSLHGRDSTGAQQERLTGLSAAADRAGIAVAYPQARGEPATWHFGPGRAGDEDVRFLLALIDELAAHDGIDARRVYAVGLSNGAQLAHHLGCVAADRLAGLGLVAGGYPRAVPCQPSHPLPLLAVHGTDDAVLPYDGRDPAWWPILDWAADWARRNGCAARSRLPGQPGAVTAEWS